MSKHTNVVRFTVKEAKQSEFEALFKNRENWDGQILNILVKTGGQTYVGYGLWRGEEKMVKVRPKMISLLDGARHLLEELSPELGVTDPVSGIVVSEQGTV